MQFGDCNQTVKTQDDKAPVFLRREPTPAEENETFQPIDNTDIGWANEKKEISIELLRKRIEPWLTSLVQSEHLTLLAGSGLTLATYKLATGDSPQLMGSKIPFEYFQSEIYEEAKRIASQAGRREGNYEDQFRVATELLRGLEILASGLPSSDEKQAQSKALRRGLTDATLSLAKSVLQGEHGLASSNPDACRNASGHLVNFLMSFASRAGTRERLHIFTTNYDRFIEAGADVAGLHLLDRFVGTVTPVFRASRLETDLHYNPPGIRGEPRYLEGVARFTKLHGSVDWVYRAKEIQRVGIPFGAKTISPYLESAGMSGTDALQIMVYPNSAKDRETTYYPYVDLFRDFAAAICRPNSTLICYGYSFGDEHINRVIADMLTIPSTHLVVISFGDPLGRITDLYYNIGRNAQFSVLVGDHVADLQMLVKHYLPKPAIDLASNRLANILDTRWRLEREETDEGHSKSMNKEESGRQ